MTDKEAFEEIGTRYGAPVAEAVREIGGSPVRFLECAKAYEERWSSPPKGTDQPEMGVRPTVSADTVRVQYEHMTAEVCDEKFVADDE